MWNPQTMELMPGFWPPKPSAASRVLLEPLRKFYLHRYYRISEVTLESEWPMQVGDGDGLLIAPNHSHDSDPHVMMEIGHRLGRQLYFMAAWQVFRMHGGIDGWVMQRFGAFSVDREGCDRRAMKQAIELLTTGRSLVVFPEGEIYHTNERLTPLREGVAFMAVSAQRDFDKANANRRVWVLPTAISYRYETDITPQLDATLAMLEERVLLRPKPGATLAERIIAFGEVMLTIKEKEQLGQPMDGDLPRRLKRLIDHMLARHETQELKSAHADDDVSVRVKSLRRHYLEKMCDEKLDNAARTRAHDALADMHLVLQLYSYPGDYVSQKPSIERMAETIEKFEEDLLGVMAKPKGARRASVRFGEPIEVKAFSSSRPRVAATELTARLEEAIRELMLHASDQLPPVTRK
jgi:1-acyl-sn-glycerol-3-phosphate acyltransferase